MEPEVIEEEFLSNENATVSDMEETTSRSTVDEEESDHETMQFECVRIFCIKDFSTRNSFIAFCVFFGWISQEESKFSVCDLMAGEINVSDEKYQSNHPVEGKLIDRNQDKHQSNRTNTKNGGRPFTCNQSDKSFSRSSLLKEVDKKVHQKIRSHTGPHRNKRFTRASDMKRQTLTLTRAYLKCEQRTVEFSMNLNYFSSKHLKLNVFVFYRRTVICM